MPTKKTDITFETDTEYRVDVDRVVKIAGMVIRPKAGATVRGELAEQFKDAIISFEVME